MDHITAMLEAMTELQAAHDARRLDYEAARKWGGACDMLAAWSFHFIV